MKVVETGWSTRTQFRLAAFLLGNVLTGVFSGNVTPRLHDERLQQGLRHVHDQEAGQEITFAAMRGR